MENAARDENRVTTLIGVSSADGITPIRVWVNPNNHRLIVDAVGGTIIGPGSSTDNSIVRWNGTDGTTIQNSIATIDDGGNMNATKYSAGGTSPVADGTYTVGNRITPVTGALGTITVKGGIITAVQEAS